MKKLLFVLYMALFSTTSSFAQKGATTLGLHGAYLFDSPNNLGLGANIGYEFIDNLRGVAEFNYLFKKDYVSYWNIEANMEYLFRLNRQFTLYPVLGLDFLGANWEGGGSKSKMGMNIGAGFEVGLSRSVGLNVEFNYKTQYDGYSLLKFGIVLPL